MNDRFKFRFYNETTNKMVYDANNNAPQPTLMQCTGLKDKNDKLIYEGDIVRFHFDNDEIIAVVEWDNNESRFYLNTTDYFGDKYVTDYEITKQEKYKIIGNTYENPELLE